MEQRVYHTCKKCGHEIEIDYELDEHFAETCEDEACPECGTVMVLDYDDLEQQAISALADRAELFEDR
jgi:uncharacterized Zn finger protein